MTTPDPDHPPHHVLYLRGFASSARSNKAAFFAGRLRAHGLTLECPDFNEPDFASMTMTRMLATLERHTAHIESGSIALIGSSLGAVVAILCAGRMPDRIDRLVLLAPALMFAKDGHRFLGPDRVSQWRATGSIDVFHYGFGEMRRLNYSFYEDSLQYDAFNVVLHQPTLIFQGLRDDAVDHRIVEKYAATRPNITLSLLDDDHQLIASLSRIWNDMEPFLGIAE